MNKNNIETLFIGTELLLGSTLNTNSQWISRELASIGLNHYRQSVIGDNFSRLEEIIIEASTRCRVLITTGGLGPTPDDITIESISNAFNTPIKHNEDVWQEIKLKFNSTKNDISNNNMKQAKFPLGAEIIKNPIGTAPGIIFNPKNDFTIITLPGVPEEMKVMWNQTVYKWLCKNININELFISKTLNFSGISESSLAEIIGDLFQNKNPTIAPYASLEDVKIRLTANANTKIEGEKLILPFEKKIKEKLGEKLYGTNEQTLPSVVIDLLRNNNETISTAESCTGGGIGLEIAKVSGASKVYSGSIAAYKNSIKEKVLGVPKNIISKYGAVSEEVVEFMAEGVKEKFDTTWSIATSGIAGPEGGSEEKPVGLVYFCVTGPFGRKTFRHIYNSSRGRNAIQRLSIFKALDIVRLFLLERS